MLIKGQNCPKCLQIEKNSAIIPFAIQKATFDINFKKGKAIMKKIICKVEYDTETSTLLSKKTFGYFGEPTGYEEALYQTESGKYFLYVNGGEQSPYAKEDIKRMSADKAKAWLEA